MTTKNLILATTCALSATWMAPCVTAQGYTWGGSALNGSNSGSATNANNTSSSPGSSLGDNALTAGDLGSAGEVAEPPPPDEHVLTEPETQVSEWSRSYARDFGNMNLGLRCSTSAFLKSEVPNLRGEIVLSPTPSQATAHAELHGRVEAWLLRSSTDLARLDARGDVVGRSGSIGAFGNVTYYLAGLAGGNFSFNDSYTLPGFDGEYKLFEDDPSAEVWYSIIRVKVSGNASARLKVSGKLQFPGTVAVGIECVAKTGGAIESSASVGTWGFSAGTTFEADLATQELTANLGASSSGVGGSIEYEFKALVLKLKVYLEGFWRKKWKTLVEETYGAVKKSIS